MIKTVLHGAGRMSQGVLAELQKHPRFELVAIVSRSEPLELLTSNNQGIAWFGTLEGIRASNGPDSDMNADADVNSDASASVNSDTSVNSDVNVDAEVHLLIDFTLPGGPATAASWCQKNHVALLSGTTGLSDEDKSALQSAATEVPVLWASNMSQGIALISALARQAAISLGDTADITISDIHHQHKQDAPSGTALTLAEAIMEGRAKSSRAKSFRAEAASSGRSVSNADQVVGYADAQEDSHEQGEIAFISVRKGEVIGQHTISFELPGEIVEITHKARDRSVFANGALSAGAWLTKQTPGYYSTSDWLNIG